MAHQLRVSTKSVTSGGGLAASWPAASCQTRGDGLACEVERDGALDCADYPVAGLTASEGLLRVFDRGLHGPPRRVALDHRRGAGLGVRGDQGRIVPGGGGIADQDQDHRTGRDPKTTYRRQMMTAGKFWSCSAGDGRSLLSPGLGGVMVRQAVK